MRWSCRTRSERPALPGPDADEPLLRAVADNHRDWMARWAVASGGGVVAVDGAELCLSREANLFPVAAPDPDVLIARLRDAGASVRSMIAIADNGDVHRAAASLALASASGGSAVRRDLRRGDADWVRIRRLSRHTLTGRRPGQRAARGPRRPMAAKARPPPACLRWQVQR